MNRYISLMVLGAATLGLNLSADTQEAKLHESGHTANSEITEEENDALEQDASILIFLVAQNRSIEELNLFLPGERFPNAVKYMVDSPDIALAADPVFEQYPDNEITLAIINQLMIIAQEHSFDIHRDVRTEIQNEEGHVIFSVFNRHASQAPLLIEAIRLPDTLKGGGTSLGAAQLVEHGHTLSKTVPMDADRAFFNAKVTDIRGENLALLMP